MIINENDYLAHHGIKGMKWGVRRTPEQLGYKPSRKERAESTGKRLLKESSEKKGYKIYGDGRIEIEKGVQIQRLVGNKSKQSLSGMTYASFTKNDNARYVALIGGKRTFSADRDMRLTFETTKPLKSPSRDEANKIFFNMLYKNPDLLKEYNQIPLVKAARRKLNPKKAKKIADSPADYDYRFANLLFGSLIGVENIKNQYVKELKSEGYNMLLDENDTTNGYSKNAVILLDAEETVKLKSKDFIDAQMVKEAKIDRRNLKLGEKWLKQQGFDINVE